MAPTKEQKAELKLHSDIAKALPTGNLSPLLDRLRSNMHIIDEILEKYLLISIHGSHTASFKVLWSLYKDRISGLEKWVCVHGTNDDSTRKREEYQALRSYGHFSKVMNLFQAAVKKEECFDITDELVKYALSPTFGQTMDMLNRGKECADHSRLKLLRNMLFQTIFVGNTRVLRRLMDENFIVGMLDCAFVWAFRSKQAYECIYLLGMNLDRDKNQRLHGRGWDDVDQVPLPPKMHIEASKAEILRWVFFHALDSGLTKLTRHLLSSFLASVAKCYNEIPESRQGRLSEEERGKLTDSVVADCLIKTQCAMLLNAGPPPEVTAILNRSLQRRSKGSSM